MTAATSTSDTPAEVAGVKSAIAYAEGVAAAHAAHGSGEGYVASLSRMQVGADDIALVQAAQEASRNAAAMWEAAKNALVDHNATVGEAYATSPSAANKEAQLTE